MPLKDSLKVGPWPGGAPFLSEVEGEHVMPDNTITTTSKALTPDRLREVLDQWCEEQPNTIWFDGIGMRWCINACLSNGVAVVKVAMPTSNDPLDSGAVFCLPAENPAFIDTFREYLLFLLTLLAIEHQYRPWLELVSTLPYTGAAAARMALQERKGQAQDDPMSRFNACCAGLAEQLRDNANLTEADRQALFAEGVRDFLVGLEVPEVKPLGAAMEQVTRDLGGKVRIEEA